MIEYRCGRCGYFLAVVDRLAPVMVRVICRNCRKHQTLDLSKPPEVARLREAVA